MKYVMLIYQGDALERQAARRTCCLLAALARPGKVTT
jgi:hypothetical protein